MKKPLAFDTVAGLTEYIPLELGGHVCKIVNVEEKKTSTGKDMLVISLDIAEGEQKGYYSDQYKKDNRENKRWACMVYAVVEDKCGNTSRPFKQFIQAFEVSNKVTVQWGDNFEAQFKGKLIGGVFGREQYQNNNGELKMSTKCRWFETIDKVRKGVAIPKDKMLQGVTTFGGGAIGEIQDDDLPF